MQISDLWFVALDGYQEHSTLVPGVQTGAFNYAVVAANSIGAQGV